MKSGPHTAVIARSFATGFGVGFLPLAPGTWASLGTLPIAYCAHWVGGFPVLAVFALAAVFLGLWSIGHMADKARQDSPEIVIDEVAGQSVALFPLSVFGNSLQELPIPTWFAWIAAFLLFRFFDILKPWPIRVLDRREGAIWVMLDDLAAGALAAVCITAAVVAAR